MVDHRQECVLYLKNCGHSSVVERLVANEKVEGSNPFARSKISLQILMDDLSKKMCSCEGNIPPFDKSEIHKYLKKVDGWDVKSNNDNTI